MQSPPSVVAVRPAPTYLPASSGDDFRVAAVRAVTATPSPNPATPARTLTALWTTARRPKLSGDRMRDTTTVAASTVNRLPTEPAAIHPADLRNADCACSWGNQPNRAAVPSLWATSRKQFGRTARYGFP